MAQIHIFGGHDSLNPQRKRRADKNAEMRDMVVSENGIRTAPHDHAVLCPGQIADQIAHIEKYGVLFGKSVIAVKLMQPFFQIKSAFAVFVKLLKMLCLRISD